MLRGTRGQAQLTNAFIGDQFTVTQADGFQPWATGTQNAQSVVGDQHTLLQVHFLKEVAITRQCWESCVGELGDGGTFQRA